MKKNILYFGLLLAGNAFGAEMTPERAALSASLRERIKQGKNKRRGEKQPPIAYRGGYRLAEYSAGKEGGTTVTNVHFCITCYIDGKKMGQKNLTRTERFLCNVKGCLDANGINRGCLKHIREHAEERHFSADAGDGTGAGK